MSKNGNDKDFRVIDNKMNKSRNRIDSVEFAYSTKVYYKSKGEEKDTTTLKSAQGNRSGIVCEIRISSIFLLWIIKPTTSCPGEIPEKSRTK